MNSSVLFGGLAFIGWSVFSSWYYVCQIKGLCGGVEVQPTEMSALIEPEITPDSVPVAVEVVLPKPVELISQDIRFDLEGTTPNNPEKLTRFISDSKSTIGDRPIMIQIKGHTCDLGSESYNDRLGMKRAENVSVTFEEAGFDPNNISLTSAGEKEPITENTSEESRTLNRRVEITIKTTDL